MSRQTQLHVFPKDVNDLLVAMHKNEPLEVALRSGDAALPKRQAFIPENISGQILVLWSERFAPNLHRSYVANAQAPYYRVDEQTESVFELSLSGLTTWEGRPALTQGRIYGVFDNKPLSLRNYMSGSSAISGGVGAKIGCMDGRLCRPRSK